MTDTTSLLFVFGMGYSALRLSRRLKADGFQISGTVRSEEKAAALRAEGIAAQVWSGEGLPDIPEGAHWLVTLPPDEGGCPAARAATYSEPGSASVTYLSTTGVYGDLNGGWAMEWSPVNPASERARARVLAEQQWMDATDGAARIVRLPGIYGPGRSPFQKLRQGQAHRAVKPGQVFSRVHANDIASGLDALVRRPHLHGIFHLCDDEPAPPQDVTAFAASLLGIEPPPEVPFEEAGLSRMARSFYSECKRVSNARAKAALGWRPLYPTYREGLSAVLAAESG